ncbi:tetratricopeptide repeat protein [Thermoplasma sp.]|uniref:tetratricopeptide repeat protein n=1 Tax=Thermoplasma sp. TaxID=1973142 RepID=UPI0026097E23|nr:tetratricopeptide repeat protein [Thermoplasma sp.]
MAEYRLDVLYKAAEALICMKKYEDALVLYEKFVKAFPDVAGGWHGLAICYEETGEREKSIEPYRKALELYLRDAKTEAGRMRRSFLWGGWCAIKLNMNQLALEMMEEAVKEDQNYAYAHLSLAIASARTGDKDRALISKRRYLDLVGEKPYEKRECEGLEMLNEAKEEASGWLRSFILSVLDKCHKESEICQSLGET